MIFQKRAQDERGLALITVVVASTVMMLLVVTLVASAYSSLSISCHDQDWNAALAAGGRHRRLHVPAQRELELLAVQRATNPPPDGEPAAFTTGSTCRVANAREYRYTSTRHESGVDGRSRSRRRAGSTTRSARCTRPCGAAASSTTCTSPTTRRGPGAVHRSAVHRRRGADTVRRPKYYYGGWGVQRDIDGRTDYPGDSDASAPYAPRSTSSPPTASTGRCTPTTRSSSAAARTSMATRRRAGRSSRAVRYRNATGGARHDDPDFANPGDPTALAAAHDAAEQLGDQGRDRRGHAAGACTPGRRASGSTVDGTMTVRARSRKQTNNGLRDERHRRAADERRDLRPERAVGDDRRNAELDCPTGCTARTSGSARPPSPTRSACRSPTSDLDTNAPTGAGTVTCSSRARSRASSPIAAENNIDITWNLTYAGRVERRRSARPGREQLRRGVPPGELHAADLNARAAT